METFANHETPLTDWPKTPLWAENYALLFYDPKQQISSVYSIGRWGSNPSLWRAMISVTLPGRHVLLGNNYGRSHDPRLVDAGIAGIEILEPHRRIRYWYDGPAFDRGLEDLYRFGFQSGQMDHLQLELVFSTDQPAWDLTKQAKDAQAFSKGDIFCNDGRLEQVGSISGEFSYGGRAYRLSDVPAMRDHSAGVRNVALLKRHVWAQGHFPNGRRFMVYVVESTLGGPPMNRACILDGGQLYEATAVCTDAMMDTQADRDRLFEMEIIAPGFGTMKVNATALSNALPLGVIEPADLVWGMPQIGSQTRRCMNEQCVRWSWDGIEGSGNLERSTPNAFEERNTEGSKEFLEVRR